MKKTYILFFTLLVFSSSIGIAQTLMNPKTPRTPAMVGEKKRSENTSRATNTFNIDYEAATINEIGEAPDPTGAGYRTFIYDMNYNYTNADTAIKYITVAFDSILDTDNNTAYPPTAIQSIAIDSIFVRAGHQNTSGQNDTIIFNIITLNSAGYPQNTVLYSDTVILNANWHPSTPSWYYAPTHAIAPGYTLPSGTKRFGVRMIYKAPIQDTLGVIFGFPDEGVSCGPAPYKPMLSPFYPTAFQYYTAYNTLLPSSGGDDFFIDCNGNGNADASDGFSSSQIASLWVQATVTHTLGINDANGNLAILSQNVPNPASKNTLINYELKSNANVTLKVFDIAGKEVMAVNEGNKTAGKHKVNLDVANLTSGVYYYTLNAGGNALTKKMVILE